MKGRKLRNPRYSEDFIKPRPKFLVSLFVETVLNFPSELWPAIFDWSLFQAGKLVMSQSKCGLYCLLKMLFSCLQGTGRTKRKPVVVTPTHLHLASGTFYVGMIERYMGHAALLLWTPTVLCINRAALLGSEPVISA